MNREQMREYVAAHPISRPADQPVPFPAAVPSRSALTEFRRTATQALFDGCAEDVLIAAVRDASQYVNGATVSQLTPVDAVAAPFQRPAAPVRVRRIVTPALLEGVAATYRSSIQVGLPPNVAIAAKYNTSHRTATRWVREARKAGFLGASLGTVAGEATA